MGAWGQGSDENDDTYNAMGFGIMERLNGMEFKETSLPEVSKIYNEEIFPNASGIGFLGSVIWALRHKLTVEEKYLQAAKTEMTGELQSAEERKTKLQEELSEIESALKNNGRSQKGTKSLCLVDRLAEATKRRKEIVDREKETCSGVPGTLEQCLQYNL